MLQRSHSLHQRSGDGDQGAAAASPASPSHLTSSASLWAASSPQAPVHRSSIAQDLHHSPRQPYHPSHLGINNSVDIDVEAHDNSSAKAPRLRAEQAVHFIPLLVFLCFFFLWLGTPSAPGSLDN